MTKQHESSAIFRTYSISNMSENAASRFFVEAALSTTMTTAVFHCVLYNRCRRMTLHLNVNSHLCPVQSHLRTSSMVVQPNQKCWMDESAEILRGIVAEFRNNILICIADLFTDGNLFMNIKMWNGCGWKKERINFARREKFGTMNKECENRSAFPFFQNFPRSVTDLFAKYCINIYKF